MHKQKKKNFTLIELMVVIAIIGVIGGVLTYNLKGSLDKGKVFKTKESKDQVRNILQIASMEEGIPLEEVVSNWEEYIRKSPLVRKPENLIKDAWNSRFEVSLLEDYIVIQSRNLQNYYRKNKITPDADDEPFM